MAANHLFVEPREEVPHRELAGFSRELSVEDHLEQDVAQLLLDVLARAPIKSFERLIGLFDEIRLQRGARLLSVPGAAAVRSQAGHEREQGFEEGAGGVRHGESWKRTVIIHRPPGRVLEGERTAC